MIGAVSGHLASAPGEYPGFTPAGAVVSIEMIENGHSLESVRTVGAAADRPEVR